MVWDLVGGAVLSAFLQVLFDRMASRQVIDFFRTQRFDETLLQKLKMTLMKINAVLIDAEEKQIANPFVKEWLDELKDAAYHAEDLLDEIATFSLGCNVEASLSSNPGGIDTLIEMPKDFESRLKKLTERLEYIAERKDIIGLKESVAGTPSPKLPTTSLVDEYELYGRENDKKEIKDFLLFHRANQNASSAIPVIAIVGIGGIGKTTLAQLLYNDSEVKNRFPTRAWAHVSQHFDVLKVTKTIYESVSLSPCNFTHLDLIQIRLKKKLANQRFLLVLDDVWDEIFLNWDVFRKSFIAGASGSRIIMTTRSQGVASIMNASCIHSLRELSDEDCSLVFKKYAYGSENTRAPEKLEKICEEIVKKCQGLPLAAKTLGSLLKSKVDEDEWNKILNSRIWDLPSDKNNILPSLRLSYYYLPSPLKKCFAYCSIFPKGYKFRREKLILLWMAEGFLQQPKNDKRMEDIGQDYFHELLSRSFFQQSSCERPVFVMHDLVNELAQFVSGEFCFKYESDMGSDISKKSRHFAYLRERCNVKDIFVDLHEVKFLRTFLPTSLSDFGQYYPLDTRVIEDYLFGLEYLRVLSLHHYMFTELPDIFGKLKHLRYLDLSYTKINSLPKSICTLYNLQTLILSYCSLVTELPENTQKLTKLVHLDLTGIKLKEMPPEFGKLKSLQTLQCFVVSKRMNRSRISELGELPHLHDDLSILELQNVEDDADAEAAKLKDKKNLKKLVFSWNTDCHDLQKETDVLEKLRPHENIEKLIIEKYGGTKFPEWLGVSSFSNMVYLHLRGCKNCSSLSLEQLTSLEELHVENMEKLVSVDSIPFKSLRILRFVDMQIWDQWSPSGGEFRSLEQLYIEQCQKLTWELPSCLPSLKTLSISDCGKLKLPFHDDTLRYTELEILHISNCESFTSLQLGLCKKLQNLQIFNCCNLKSTDVLNCESLESLPEQMHCLFSSLETLSIFCCPKLESSQDGGFPSSLKYLFVTNSDLLIPQKGWGLNKMPSLSHLEITGGRCNMKSFPEEGLLPISLTYLQISEFSELETLDLSELQHLTHLEKLVIRSCVCLCNLSDGELPRSVSLLIIENCSLLTAKCQDNQGDYWNKISHIDTIQF